MFIATTDNHSARIGLRQGDIVSLVFRAQRGLEALDHIRKITAGRFSFSDAVLDKAAHVDLPYTADLLALTDRRGVSAAPAGPRSRRLPPRRALRLPPRLRRSSIHSWHRAQAVIESELTEFVGPIAPLLCREHIARAAAAGPPWDWRKLVEAVAREIGDRAKEDRFKQQALARLAIAKHTEFGRVAAGAAGARPCAVGPLASRAAARRAAIRRMRRVSSRPRPPAPDDRTRPPRATASE